MLVPPREAGGDPRSLGGESLPFAITAKSKHPDVAAAYIDFLTNANAARVLVETGNLPAMPTTAQPSGAAAQGRVRRVADARPTHDGIVPYLDYATPTFYDDITAGVQRLLAGPRSRRTSSPAACRATSRSSPDALTARPPGEPRRVAYLYLLPGLALFAAFVLVPLVHAGVDLAVRVGRRHARDVGRARQLRGAGAGRRAARARSCTRRCCWCSTRRCRSRSGCCSRRAASRARVRGLAAVRTILFLPQVIALVVVAVTWRMIYQPTGWLGNFDLALPAVGLVGTWVAYGLCFVLFMAGVQKIPQSLYDAARVDGAGAGARVLRGDPAGAARGDRGRAHAHHDRALRNFDLVYLTTAGGPGDATTVPALEVYERAFRDRRGRAARRRSASAWRP